tara:strand:- start:2126 stop:3166 length:1041 start_codon:yes stop_codon:yes gene_type:complete
MAQINKPNLYFNTLLWTGNNSARSLTGVGFQPDWIWIKDRTGSNNHAIFDSVRGVNKYITSSQNIGELNQPSSGYVSAFDSDGFSGVTGSSSYANWNGSGNNYVGWNWKAGGAGSANTDGSTSATVSASTTSGFSIAKYTGTGSGATIGHGLGAKPQIVFYKNLSANADWMFQSTLLANRTQLILNNSDGTNTDSRFANVDSWSNSVFTVGTYADQNENNSQHIAYVFAEKKGYSKFGTYTGNGNANGTFVYTGFRPAWVMHKRTDTTNNWIMQDNKRVGYNADNRILKANSGDAEQAVHEMDFVSNGFKVRTTGAGSNASGGTYIYMAFAENPIVGTNNIPATAR